MNDNEALASWMALAHGTKWGTEKINRLIVGIVHNRKLSLAEFFSLPLAELTPSYDLSPQQLTDIEQLRTELPSYAFLAESLINQGFYIIPLNAKEYPEIMKKNLKIQAAPPVLYCKGNVELLHKDSVAVVGSRNASERSLEFTRTITRQCVARKQVVVSGFAAGVDKLALDTALECNGQSIVVLPQGILTFGGGIKKYYKQIVAGDVLIVSAFHPKTPWSVGLAMSRNAYIYGLAESIYVAESNTSGGTWNGVLDGIKRGRKIFIRKPEQDESNANELLILCGAIPIDMKGSLLTSYSSELENKVKSIVSQKQATTEEIRNGIGLDIEPKELYKILTHLSFLEPLRIKHTTCFALKGETPKQKSLF